MYRAPTNYLLRLQQILEHFDPSRLSQEEVTFLQLHYMELLDTEEIATLLKTDIRSIETLAAKFSTRNLPAVG